MDPLSWFSSSDSSLRLERLPKLIGIVPVKALWCRSSASRADWLLHPDGMVPSKSLSPRFRTTSVVMLASCVGSGPVRLLSCSSNSSNFDGLPQLVGMSPDNLLPERSRWVNVVKAATSDGMAPLRPFPPSSSFSSVRTASFPEICPESWLLDKARTFRPVRPPNSEGISPVSPFPLRSTSTSEVNPVSQVGRTPPRSLSFKYSLVSAVRLASEGMLPDKWFSPRSNSVNAVMPFRLAGMPPVNWFRSSRNTSRAPSFTVFGGVVDATLQVSGIDPANWLLDRSNVVRTVALSKEGTPPDSSFPERSTTIKLAKLCRESILPVSAFFERSNVSRLARLFRDGILPVRPFRANSSVVKPVNPLSDGIDPVNPFPDKSRVSRLVRPITQDGIFPVNSFPASSSESSDRFKISSLVKPANCGGISPENSFPNKSSSVSSPKRPRAEGIGSDAPLGAITSVATLVGVPSTVTPVQLAMGVVLAQFREPLPANLLSSASSTSQSPTRPALSPGLGTTAPLEQAVLAVGVPFTVPDQRLYCDPLNARTWTSYSVDPIRPSTMVVRLPPAVSHASSNTVQ